METIFHKALQSKNSKEKFKQQKVHGSLQQSFINIRFKKKISWGFVTVWYVTGEKKKKNVKRKTGVQGIIVHYIIKIKLG